MDLFEAMEKRHSYRGSFTDKPVLKEDLVKILDAGLRAPSGKNQQTTEFIIVDDPELVKKIVTTVKNSTNVPVIAKVGLGTTNYLNTVKIAIDSGIDAITAINTVRAMAIDVETQRPILSNKFGGLSGTPIKPIALRCVYEIASKHDIPIIGCGGISTWEDAIEFFLAGASAIQLGSAIGDNWINVFDDINKGILEYMKKKNYSNIEDMVGLAKKF